MIQVTIDDNIVDLLPGEVMTVTKQVNDIGELKDRQSDFSNKVKAADTERNRATFGHAHIIGSSSNKPYRMLTASAMDSGVPTISNGYAILETSMEFTIYSSLVEMFSRLEGKSLRDLDLSDMDQHWTLANVTGSFGNTWDSGGFIWPIVDYGLMDVSTRRIFIDQILPGVFFKTLFTRIHTEAGYTFTIDDLPDARFDQMILPASIIPIKGDKNISGRVNMVASLTTPQSVTTGFVAIVFQTVVTPAVPANYNSGTGTFEFIDPVRVRFDFDLDITNNTVGDIDLQFQNTVGGVFETITIPASSTVNEVFSFEEYFEQNSSFNFTVRGSAAGVDLDSGTITLNFISGEPGGIAHDATNDYITMAGLVPDIGQKEFIKTVCQMLCLTAVPDPVTNNIDYKWFGELKQNLSSAKDWTGKLDMESVQVEYRFGDYAQTNWLRYKKSEDDPTLTGNGSFTIDDTTLPKEKDVVELPFASSTMVKRLDGEDVAYINLLDGSGNFSVDSEPRVLILEKKTQVGNDIEYIEVLGGGPVSSNEDTDLPYTYFILPDKDYNLGFEDNLIDTHYSDLVSMLHRVKKLTGKFNLNAQDINQCDHFIPIWLSQFGHYFYLNKIEDFVAGQLTKCTLIRI